MIPVFMNNLKRILEKKKNVMIYMTLTIISILAAVYLAGMPETAGNIALVSKSNISLPKSQNIKVTKLKKVPPKADLVSQHFDAVVEISAQGKIKVHTLRDKQFESKISAAVGHGGNMQETQTKTKKEGSTVMGFMMMFLLIQSLYYNSLFGEDKEKHLISRVLVSDVSHIRYLTGHLLFSILFTFLPAFLTVSILWLAGCQMGFTLLQYTWMIGLLSAFASAVSLLFYTIFQEETASMAGSAVFVLTSVLAGGFYSFSGTGRLFNLVTGLLPQKAFLSFLRGVEQGRLTTVNEAQIFYVTAVTVAFLLISAGLSKRKVCRS